MTDKENDKEATKNQPEARKKLSGLMLASLLSQPPMPFKRSLQSLDLASVREVYAPPVTFGYGHDKLREEVDLAFDSAGGYEAIYSSLTQHAIEMGQYPVSGFVGYGALQNIAQNGMIQNCIRTVADDVTRNWIQVVGGEETDEERLIELQDLQDIKYKLRKVFNDAQCLVGFMGGAFVYINTDPKGQENGDPKYPLAVNSKSEELAKGRKVHFQVIDPVNVCSGAFNALNPLMADYMNPQRWYVQGQEVHGSRMLRIVDNEPPTLYKPSYNFLGIPQAQILWDYVLHWNQCRAAEVDLVNKVRLLAVKTAMSDTMSSADGIQQMDALVMAMQRYSDNNSVVVVDREDDVVNIQTTVSGVSDVVRQSLESIAAINRTPAVKILGISPSGFNATGESDIKNYYDHIKSKQELKREAIQKCLEVIQLVEFGEIDPSITFVFNPLAKDDQMVAASAFATKVGAVTALYDRNIITGDEFRQLMKKEEDMGLGSLDGDYSPDDDAPNLENEGPLSAMMAQQQGASMGSPKEPQIQPKTPTVKGEGIEEREDH
jgi:phage-related protein (TIGR01555 family)